MKSEIKGWLAVQLNAANCSGSDWRSNGVLNVSADGRLQWRKGNRRKEHRGGHPGVTKKPAHRGKIG